MHRSGDTGSVILRPIQLNTIDHLITGQRWSVEGRVANFSQNDSLIPIVMFGDQNAAQLGQALNHQRWREKRIYAAILV